MNLHNASTLSKTEQKELIKKISPYLNGVTAAPVNDIKIGKKVVFGTFSGPSNTFTVDRVTDLEDIKPITVLDEAINAGTVVKNGNWFMYEGKNYNGINKITAALNS